MMQHTRRLVAINKSIHSKFLSNFQKCLYRKKYAVVRVENDDAAENKVQPHDYEASKRFRDRWQYIEPTDLKGYPTFKEPEVAKLDVQKSPEELEKELLGYINDQFADVDAFNSRSSEERISEEFAKFLKSSGKQFTQLNAVSREIIDACIYPAPGAEKEKRDFFFKFNVASFASSFNLFLVPLLEFLSCTIKEEKYTAQPGFRVVILTNTNERAILLEKLINSNGFAKLLRETTPNCFAMALVSGRKNNLEIDLIDRHLPEIIISTPARLQMHLKNSDYLNNTKTVVLDMAHDLLNNEESKKSVDEVLSLTKDRMTAVFSDQLSEDQVPAEIFTNEKRITKVSNQKSATIAKCSHQTLSCENAEEVLKTVHGIAKQNRDKKIAIFFASPSGAAFYHRTCALNQVYGYLYHSGISQSMRERMMNEFNATANGILFASNEAVYGLTQNVDLVIHVGPVDAHQYAYRVALTKAQKPATSIIITHKGETQAPIETVEFKAGEKVASDLNMTKVYGQLKSDDFMSRYSDVLLGTAQLTQREALRQHRAKLAKAARAKLREEKAAAKAAKKQK